MIAVAPPSTNAPLTTPFFYGWLIVGTAVAAGVIGAGLDHVAFGVLFKPLTEDRGWDRSTISGAIALGTILAGLASPFMGTLADRIGPRLLMTVGALLAGVCTLLLAFSSEPWQFYLAYVPARAIATTTLFGIVPLTAVANGFALKRPRAIAMVSMALPLGGALLAVLYHLALGALGWRWTLGLLATSLVVVAAPAWWLLRRRPEDCGLLPDGGGATPPANASAAAPAGPGEAASWTPGEALHTRAFWLIIGSFMMAALSIGTIGFHLVAYFTDMGIAPQVATGFLTVYALSSGVAILFWGYLAERLHVRYLSIGILALSACGVVLLISVREPITALAFSVLFGFTARSQSTLVQVLLADYYGRRFFGAISGITLAFQMCLMGVSPWIAAVVFDATGSYEAVFTGFVALYALAGVCMLLARRPVRPMEEA